LHFIWSVPYERTK